MANLSSKERHIRKLSKVGKTSYAITIPIEDIRALGWRERQKMNVKREGNSIIITDWKKK